MARTGKRPKQVMVRFTDLEYDYLKRLAESRSLSMAEVIRELIKSTSIDPQNSPYSR